MNPITIPNISIPTIGIPTIGIPSVGFPSASGGGGLVWPAGMKEHIKAWYDPKKQGMTNYDVIESYAEDFTANKWVGFPSIAEFTKTAKGLHITNVIAAGNLLRTGAQQYASEMVVKVSGIPPGFTRLVYRYDSNTNRIQLTQDGIYTLPAGIPGAEVDGYNGFVALEAFGECDITIEQLPTSILKDLSGNGNHAYLYGGKGKLNSGMGVYKFDFLSDLRINSAYLLYTERQDDKICSLAGHPAGWLFQFTSLSDIPAFKVEVKGIVNDKFTYRWYDEKGNRGADFVIDKDGIYEFPMSYSVETNTGVGIVCNICQDNVCFTQIPDYPNQLCYDGKMYAVCYDFPILTDYTVMAERTWFERQNRACFLSKITTSGTGAFGFEFYNEYNEDTTYSFGRVNNVEQFKDGITYQITNSYNGIVKLDYVVNGKDNAELYIGKLRPSERPAFIGCHGAIIVADRSFTEEEINWLKQNWDKI